MSAATASSPATEPSSPPRVKAGVPHGGGGSPPASSCSISGPGTARCQPICATVPYQLLRGKQLSPTRSVSSSSSSVAAAAAKSHTVPTSRCSSLAHPGGNASDARLLPWHRLSARQDELTRGTLFTCSQRRCQHCKAGLNLCQTAIKIEKGRPQQQAGSGVIRCTASLGAITGPYLSGQWPPGTLVCSTPRV